LFRRCDIAPLTGFESREGEATADRSSNQPQRGKANGGGHAAHLAIAAFGQSQGQPGGGNGFAFADRRDAGGEVWLVE
jgi:hypothetical protein